MRKYYLLCAGIIFIIGILSSYFDIIRDVTPRMAFLSFFLIILILMLSFKKDLLFVIFLVVSLFLAGAARYDIFNRIGPGHIKNHTEYYKQQVFLQGEIISDVEKGRKISKFILNTGNGLVLVNLYGKQDFYQYGDLVGLKGSLKAPVTYGKKGRFNYRKYLAAKRIYSVLNVKTGDFSKKTGEDQRPVVKIVRFVYRARSAIEARIEKYIKAPYSSVLLAILLGKRSGIPPDLRDLFVKTGTLHILAISGLHVGIIYFVLRIVLKILRVRKNMSVAICILCLIAYAIMAGARPSILRATTMFAILGMGEVLKRKISTLNLVGLSGLVILIVNPNQVFDISFIFSYAAVLSIIILSPILYRFISFGRISQHDNIFRSKVLYYIIQSISVSMAAWVGLLPLVAYYFGLISPVIVIANLVAVPLLLLIMGSGILFISVGYISGILAGIFAQSTWFFIALLIASLKFFKFLPFAYFYVKPPTIGVVMLYYIVLTVMLNSAKIKKLAFSFLT